MEINKDNLTYEEYVKWRETHNLHGYKTPRVKKEGKDTIGNLVEETLKIARILKENGVNLSEVKSTKLVGKKQEYILLEEIKQEGINIQKIIEENKLDGKFRFGAGIRKLRNLYNGRDYNSLTEVQSREAEELWLVKSKVKSKEDTVKLKNEDRKNGDEKKVSTKELTAASRKGTSIERTLKIAIILKENGVDLNRLQLAKTVNERIKYRLLEELEQEGVDIQKIIEENKLDGKFEIGAKIMAIRKAYNGLGVYEMTEKEREKVEEIGIIPKPLMERERKKRELTQKREQARQIYERYNQLLVNDDKPK